MTTQSIKFVFSEAESKLRKKKHPCKPLQEAVNAAGMGMVGFETLETNVPEAEMPACHTKHMANYDCFNQRHYTVLRKPRPGKPVTWNGKDYPSISAAAKDSDLSLKQLRTRLEMGYEYAH